MTSSLRSRIEALELVAAPAGLRLPTFAEWNAGYMNDGEVLPNGEVIRLPSESMSWDQVYVGCRPSVCLATTG